MDITRYFSTRQKEGSRLMAEEFDDKRGKANKNLPLLASPINENAYKQLPSSLYDVEKRSSSTNTGENSDGTATLSGNEKTSSGNVIIYKEHHEASTIELFYDLFFVANLAYFTAMHQHTDAQSLSNYLKLFTLLWFTWLITALFDVRFSIDCLWNRLHKAIQFGVFAGFVFAGPVYDKYTKSGVAKSYDNFAIVLIVSRVAMAVQYAVVMWQGRMFRHTLLPLGLSTMVHAIAAVGYTITLVVFPIGTVGLTEQVTWVVISIVEGLLIFLIAMTWRIVSFKYTHLVERLQLLTLIIIGEGIIGVVKSIACITKGQTNNNSKEIGTVVAAVVLLYLIWMIYFDQFSDDRFGTVRQQIWSILHYPLHMAILICVEGNTSLIVWNSAVQALKWIWSMEPADYSKPAAGFADITAFLNYLNQCMYKINGQFPNKYWNATYDWERNFTAIENYTTTYGFSSDEWNNKTGSLVEYIFTNAQIFVFEAHSETLAKLNAVTAPLASRHRTLDAVFDVFNVTIMQFYIGAGAMLIVLAMMYWFNKLHKTKVEFGEMINRVVVGFTLLIIGVVTVLADKSTTGFKFVASNWAIPILVFLFVSVLLLDNVLLAISYHTSRRASNSRGSSWGATTVVGDTDTAGLISKYASTLSISTPDTVPLQQIDTAYQFYPSPPTVRDFAMTPRNTQGPDLGGETNHDFSYQNTPTSPDRIGLGMRHDDADESGGVSRGYSSGETFVQDEDEEESETEYRSREPSQGHMRVRDDVDV